MGREEELENAYNDTYREGTLSGFKKEIREIGGHIGFSKG